MKKTILNTKKGRNTLVRLPEEYVNKIHKYINKNDNISKTVMNLIETVIENPFEYLDAQREPYKERKIYLNQNDYRYFTTYAEKLGCKNGTEAIKKTIDYYEEKAITTGNDNKPESNPWAIKIGEHYLNTALYKGILIIGDEEEKHIKVENYLKGQLLKKSTGNETDIYTLDGDLCKRESLTNPFDNIENISINDFIDMISKVIKARVNAMTLADNSFNTINYLNTHSTNYFSRIFIFIKNDNISLDTRMKLDEIIKNEKLSMLHNHSLFNMNIHLIISSKAEYLKDDDANSNDFDNVPEMLLSTTAQIGNPNDDKLMIKRPDEEPKYIEVAALYY